MFFAPAGKATKRAQIIIVTGVSCVPYVTGLPMHLALRLGANDSDFRVASRGVCSLRSRFCVSFCQRNDPGCVLNRFGLSLGVGYRGRRDEGPHPPPPPPPRHRQKKEYSISIVRKL